MGKRDLWLIGGLLLLAAALFLSSWLLGRPGAYAVVRVDGREVARYNLDQNGTYELNGGTNILVIEDGAARITEADCPDRLCVRQGWISKAGQAITCLPNRLTVTVYGPDDGVDVYM